MREYEEVSDRAEISPLMSSPAGEGRVSMGGDKRSPPGPGTMNNSVHGVQQPQEPDGLPRFYSVETLSRNFYR